MDAKSSRKINPIEKFNIADERPLEYALWNRSSPVPAYRVDWGEDALEHTWLTESRTLLFHPPWLASPTPVEISVVYHRAGYEAHEYNAVGRAVRLRFEQSMAIKCPSVLGHLTTLKKVQQALTVPGALERYLTEAEAAMIRETFVPVYSLDESTGGQHARRLACEQPANHILKPSLEGGGHNVHGDAIPSFLASVPSGQWSCYILMERIHPPASSNLLMGPAGVDGGEVVSELGILGSCLWRRGEQGTEMLENAVAGFTFKTKHAEIEEMNVVKGYGCFDTPRLVDDTERRGSSAG